MSTRYPEPPPVSKSPKKSPPGLHDDSQLSDKLESKLVLMEMFRFDSILADMSSSPEPTIMGVEHKELASEKVQRENLMGIEGYTVG